MTWDELVEGYLQHQRRQGYSPSTFEDAKRWLRRFVASAREQQAAVPEELTAAHLNAFHQELLWTKHCRGKLYSPNTVAKALGYARSLMTWATDRGILLCNPAAHMVLPKPVQPARRHLSVADIDAVSAAMADDFHTLRNRAILETIYQTGVRVGECCGLDLEDLDLSGQNLHVRRGKGSKHRRLPLSDHLLEVLNRYLREGRPKFKARPEETALFLSQTGSRLQRPGLSVMLRLAGEKAGLEGFTPHLIRHAFATHLVQGGADLRYVQELLGHAHLGTTQIYTRISAIELAQAHHRTHPRAQRRSEDDPDFSP